MKKRIISLLLAVFIVVSLLPNVALADPIHSHSYTNGMCECGEHNGEHTGWTNWGDQEAEWTTLPSGNGNYYLTHDVTLNDEWAPESTAGNPVVINLCLNGYVIKQTGVDKRVIDIKDYVTLNLYDCNSTKEYKFTVEDDTGLWIYAGEWGNSDIEGDTVKKVTGGIITGGNLLGEKGGGVYVSENNSYFTMYGGTICGNTLSAEDRSGGGLYICDGNSFKMYGGAISGNTADYGGGIHIFDGSFTMYGGTISDNTAASGSGAVHLNGNDACFTMYGGTISGNTAVGCAGSVECYSFTMYGGTISDNRAEELFGGVMCKGPFTMTGGIITGNTAPMFAGVYVTGNYTIGGTAKIVDNYTDDGANDNVPVLMMEGEVFNAIAIGNGENGAEIPTEMCVGVSIVDFDTMETSVGQFTNNSVTEGDKRYFFSDDLKYCVNFNNKGTDNDAADDYLELKLPEEGNYAINVIPSVNGKVTASVNEAAENDPITLTVTPDYGYQLKKLEYTYDTTTTDITGTKQFNMPAANVVITAEFELGSKEDPEISERKDYTTVTIGGNKDKAETKAEEANPDTGAPIMSFAAVAVVLGAVYVLSKRR